MPRIVDRVRKIARPIVAAQGLELVDVEYKKEGERWYLKVFLDNSEGELELKHCEVVSRLLGEELDNLDFIDSSYSLQVSSPGIERPFKRTVDYQKNVGKQVLIKTYAPVEGDKEITGELVEIEDDNLVKVKTDKGVMEIPLSKIAQTVMIIDI